LELSRNLNVIRQHKKYVSLDMRQNLETIIHVLNEAYAATLVEPIKEKEKMTVRTSLFLHIYIEMSPQRCYIYGYRHRFSCNMSNTWLEHSHLACSPRSKHSLQLILCRFKNCLVAFTAALTSHLSRQEELLGLQEAVTSCTQHLTETKRYVENVLSTTCAQHLNETKIYVDEALTHMSLRLERAIKEAATRPSSNFSTAMHFRPLTSSVACSSKVVAQPGSNCRVEMNERGGRLMAHFEHDLMTLKGQMQDRDQVIQRLVKEVQMKVDRR
jgi:hypothetical protein